MNNIKEMPMGLRFSLLHRAFKQQMDKQLSEHDLTGVQFGVLAQLKRLEEQGKTDISQRDLENASRVTHPTMTEIIKRLEKKGFINCHPRPGDRRYKIISSTALAAQLGEDMRKTEQEVMDWLSRDLSPEELDSFLTILDKLLCTALSCQEKGEENELR